MCQTKEGKYLYARFDSVVYFAKWHHRRTELHMPKLVDQSFGVGPDSVNVPCTKYFSTHSVIWVRPAVASKVGLAWRCHDLIGSSTSREEAAPSRAPSNVILSPLNSPSANNSRRILRRSPPGYCSHRPRATSQAGAHSGRYRGPSHSHSGKWDTGRFKQLFRGCGRLP